MSHCFAGTLAIGPVSFLLQSEQPFSYARWAYRPFWQAHACDHGTVCLPVRIGLGDVTLPVAEPVYAAGEHWAYYRQNDHMLFMVHANRWRAGITCKVDWAMSSCHLCVDGRMTEAPLRYPLDQILTWGMLGKCGGVLLHAAGVAHDGVGYVLAGRSGAGKSTLSGFCHDAGWDILNDDRVIVHPDPATGKWLLSGTPWHGTGKYAKNRTVPLGGVYLLQQDTENVAEDIALQEARYRLMDVAGIAWFEETWSQQALDALVRLTEEVPVRRLRFTRSADAVEALGG